MPQAKKLLILSCSTGMGHWRAGEALRLSCQKNYPHIQVTHLDIAVYFNIFAYIYIIFGYNFFSKLFPSLYKIIYYQTDNTFTKKIFNILGPILALSSRRLLAYIKQAQPDVIISTHFLPDIIFPAKLLTKHYTVVTDYHAHAVWLSSSTSGLFVATPEIVDELKNEQTAVIPSGIPLVPSFFEHKDVSLIKTQLGINNSLPTILIMPLFTKNKNILHILHHIEQRIKEKNIIIVTGRNKQLANQLRALQKTYIHLPSPDTSTDELMRCADVIVSKAGGLTTSEAIYLQKPLILAYSIPGQEEDNMKYFEKNNFALIAKSASDVAEKINIILHKPNMLNKKSYPDASKIILEHVLKD
jgi:processive 1,2-diacylglycerol beta-glucosyltransferase